MRESVSRIAISIVVLLACISSGHPARAADMGSYQFVHDPSLIKQGKTYHLFSTGDVNVGTGLIQMRTSTDLRHWQYAGTVFQDYPDWILNKVEAVTSLWAPDVSFFNGLYHLYYAASTFGSNTSVIALATTPTLDQSSKAYHWTDRGLVIESSSPDDWNAIDPNLVLDAKGHPWLAFGSFWTGIKLTPLSAQTGKPVSKDPTLYSIASRPGSTAIEAPFIIYKAPYYYLFASFDRCCQGVDSTYRIMVGRAHALTGPFLDKSGKDMADGGGTQLLAGNGYERGPGGQSIARDGSRYLMVYHYYDARDAGNAKVHVRTLTWSASGWPLISAPVAP